MKRISIFKRLLILVLVFILSINSFATVVSDNDGATFITKAEFDSLKNNFQAQIDSYNMSIDSKIEGAIASYLAGIKVSTQEKLSTISLGSLIFQGRGTDSDDSAKTKNQACKVDYTWHYGTCYVPTRQYAVTVSYLKTIYDGSAAKFNGVRKSGTKWIYNGNKKYLVTKSDSREKIYNGYGAEKNGGSTGTADGTYMNYFPSRYSGTIYQYPALKWDDFIAGVDGAMNPSANLNWTSLGYDKTGPSAWWQSRQVGAISGGGVYKGTESAFCLSSQSYEEFDDLSDSFINVFSSSNHTFLYSLNQWDGLGFGGWSSVSGTNWGFDGSLISRGWHTWSDLVGFDIVVDWNNLPWNLSASDCAKFVGLAAIFNVNWNNVSYPNNASVYVGGSLISTEFNLTDNIPLVNIGKDGVLKLPLEFKDNGTYKIWLDTVKANTFSTIRSTALCPEGKTLAADGSFTITRTTAAPSVALKVPVEKNTTVFIKWKNSANNGNTDITFDDEFIEEVAN